MSYLKDGKYLIVLALPSAPPPFPVGANHEGGPVDPVVAEGKDRVWTVHKLGNEKYVLILEQTGTHWLGKGMGDEVVVGNMPVIAEWTINEHEDDRYSIEVPSDRWPTRAWTLDNTESGTKVRLGVYELPTPGQLWNFIPHRED